MSRAQIHKLAYLVGLIIVCVTAGAAVAYFDLDTLAWIIVIVVLLVPGRLGGYFLRDLFLSRRLLDARKFESAIDASVRLLRKLDQQPWRRHFIYCFFGIYTWNPRAMALNNMGAAEMELGKIESAETHLNEAVGLDVKYPVPYYNLAITAAVLGDHQRSNSMVALAQKHGFSGSPIDQAVMRIGSAYAKIQSIPN